MGYNAHNEGENKWENEIYPRLVTVCNKITRKDGMLDKIINYVQSLQQQIEINKVSNENELIFLQLPIYD